MKLLLPFLLFTLFSCSSYVNKMHQNIDQANGRVAYKKSHDRFNYLRRKHFDPNQNPRSLTSLSTKNNKYQGPRVKRQYSQVKKRFKSEDLVDNDNSGSLWLGNGQSSFLFSKNNHKKNGDIIIIQVQKALKTEIAAELARTFPNRKRPAAPEAAKEAAKKPASEAKPDDKAEPADENKVFDRISSVIVEEINKDHLLVRGRKEVLYKKSKRTIEVQGLLSRRDISDDDTIRSQNLIESSVVILR